MVGILKERMSRIANLIGAISFGILVSRHTSIFPRIHMFMFSYFIIVLAVCFFLYNKSVKPGFENGVADVAFFALIHLIKVGPSLKAFLFGAYIFVSISSIFHKVKQDEKGKDPLRGILYFFIVIVVVVLFLERPTIWWELTSFDVINDTMWLFFGLVSLAISI